MIGYDDVSDYIYKELEPVSHFYDGAEYSKRVNTLNLHYSAESTVPKNAMNSFITSMKGVVRRSESSYLEIVGPISVVQTCFLEKGEHLHYEWKVTTSIILI